MNRSEADFAGANAAGDRKSFDPDKMKVSVITAVYNGKEFLEETIQSVLGQSYRNVEYIIIDGGSTDGTQDIIRAHEAHLAYWVSERDAGIYDAMNKGIAKASGELIGILNCGDRYLPSTLEKVVSAAQAEGSDCIITSHVRRFSRSSDTTFVNRRFPEGLRNAHIAMPINHPSTFVSAEVYRNIGGFSLKYRIVADSEFILRAYRRGIRFVYLDEIIAEMELGGVSEQWDSIGRRAKEHFRIRAEHGYPVAQNAILFLRYLLKTTSRTMGKAVLGDGLLRFYYSRKR